MARTKRQPSVKPAAEGTCLCGCGETPAAKLQFRIGHDARLKGYGRRIEAGEMSRSSVSDAAARWLAGHGIKVGRARPA